MDSISKEYRSWNMSRIRSRNTKPELIVRKYLFKHGFRYRLNGKVAKKYFPKGVLPGKPDLVFRKFNTVVFVNGCFWHSHDGCKKSHLPKSNVTYWKEKLEKNKVRDRKNYRTLKEMGFKVLIIWECEVKNPKKLETLIEDIIRGK